MGCPVAAMGWGGHIGCKVFVLAGTKILQMVVLMREYTWHGYGDGPQVGGTPLRKVKVACSGALPCLANSLLKEKQLLLVCSDGVSVDSEL